MLSFLEGRKTVSKICQVIFQKPWPAWRIIRLKRWLELLYNLSTKYGLFRSAWTGLPSVQGSPVPWLSFPAIEFLNTIVPKDARIFEFGIGASTLWWATRGNAVYGIEFKEKWYDFITGKITELKLRRKKVFARIYLAEVTMDYVWGALYNEGNFDVIVVDGEIEDTCRLKCAKSALEHLTPGGILVIDNIDWLPQTRNYMASQCRERQLYPIPFMGFTSLVPYTTTTMVYLKDPRVLISASNVFGAHPYSLGALFQELE